MTEEYYHANLFGEVVDIDLAVQDEEEKLLLDKKGREFNIFTFTEALASRKRKDAWVLYQKALTAGVSAEEIFWKVVWQIKSLLLASKTKSAEEAEMKSFPYSKAKGNLKNWKDGELESMLEQLVIGYHKIRRGDGETETFLEKLVLKL